MSELTYSHLADTVRVCRLNELGSAEILARKRGADDPDVRLRRLRAAELEIVEGLMRRAHAAGRTPPQNAQPEGK